MKISSNHKNQLLSYFTGIYDIKEVKDYIELLRGFIEIVEDNLTFIIYYTCDDMTDIPLAFIKELIRTRYKGLIKDKKMNIHLILSPAKKRLEDGNLSAKNVNSGFTFVKRNDIYIFRKEEFPKVIIHELIHHEKHIHQDYFKKDNEFRLKRVFNIHENATMILNEAIIELWATLMQLIFVSKKYKIDLMKLFRIELHYSLFKTYQIYMKQSQMSDRRWQDNSNIFCYIIFKTIFMYYLPELMKIYKYPILYDDTILTDFIINHKELPKIRDNPSYHIQGRLVVRDELSLCFMLLSDL